MATAAVLEPISSRIPADEKTTFIEACEEIGTTPSNAIRMFIRAFNTYRGFPFDTSQPYRLSAEAERSYEEAKAAIANGTAKRYATVDDLRKDLGL